jgi:para-nitrobenzyl esterase
MASRSHLVSIAALACFMAGWAGMRAAPADLQVKVTGGLIAGELDAATGVRAYRGVPFAAPPTGNRRWQPPAPVVPWTGVRQATAFGPRCMQRPLFGDMVFRSDGMSEDCLYLNVWTPARSAGDRLPVLVYFFGGGYAAGDGSEPRYDGASMARKGIVSLTVNYRLGIFGFFAHPELTQESPHHASGNYELMDQAAALQWVHDNIAAFGGDPARVTIAGESAGSISVSALMASPLSRGLIAGAIGESGAMIEPTLPPVPLQQAEAAGVKFAQTVGASSLAALRSMPADRLLEAGGGVNQFPSTIDGYALPKAPVDIFEAGQQAHVPLLVGSNSAEQDWRSVLGTDPPTPAGYAAALKRLYGERADEVAKAYPGATSEEVYRSARELASDRFIAYSTWKWFDVHSRTGGQPSFYYFYAHPRPAPYPRLDAANGRGAGRGNGRGGRAGGPGSPAASGDAAGAPVAAPPPPGAVHSAEIEYALGNLSTHPAFVWTADDQKVSSTLQSYFANFVKTGDPNGPGLPRWPAGKGGGKTVERMRIDVDSHAFTDSRPAAYMVLDSIYTPR